MENEPQLTLSTVGVKTVAVSTAVATRLETETHDHQLIQQETDLKLVHKGHSEACLLNIANDKKRTLK
uniref:Uncharacterized protein n=1 Tax=Amphimedon queenslandica TaxID=400682 RepID=A0A1X7USD5_AMPQE